jgi:hypothetical protein
VQARGRGDHRRAGGGDGGSHRHLSRRRRAGRRRVRGGGGRRGGAGRAEGDATRGGGSSGAGRADVAPSAAHEDGVTGAGSGPAEDSDPFAAAKALGIFRASARDAESDPSAGLTTRTIIERVAANRAAYEARNRTKTAKEATYYERKGQGRRRVVIVSLSVARRGVTPPATSYFRRARFRAARPARRLTESGGCTAAPCPARRARPAPPPPPPAWA